MIQLGKNMAENQVLQKKRLEGKYASKNTTIQTLAFMRR